MSDIPQVAIDRAVEAAEATSTRRHLRDEAARAAYMTRLREVFESGGPIIAEAAVEGERRKARKLANAAERLADAAERLCDIDGQAAEMLDPALDEYMRTKAALAAIDKEGETNE